MGQRVGQILGQMVSRSWADGGQIMGVLTNTCNMDSVPNTKESLRKILSREETSLGLMAWPSHEGVITWG